MKIGAHVSIAGGLEKAPIRAHSLGCECFQIFSRSPRGGRAQELTPDKVNAFLTECRRLGLSSYHIHVPYYTNLASPSPDVRRSSIEVVREEMLRASAIGARGVVLHPGSPMGKGRSEGLRLVVEAVREILSGGLYSPLLLIENTAGQGEIIGDTFEEIAAILDGAKSDGVGVCLDTAHLFASGYDIKSEGGFGEVLAKFDATLGLEHLRLIHANDSKVGLGGRRDRHEHIGHGTIGIDGFRRILSDPRISHIDIIVETDPGRSPEDGALLAKDVMILKNLRDAAPLCTD
jgi:deoxyribonuclease-4